MKKLIWFISFIFLFSGISVASAKPIVGLLFPTSGPFSAMGTDMKQGSEIAIEEINAKGGVLGKKV